MFVMPSCNGHFEVWWSTGALATKLETRLAWFQHSPHRADRAWGAESWKEGEPWDLGYGWPLGTAKLWYFVWWHVFSFFFWVILFAKRRNNNGPVGFPVESWICPVLILCASWIWFYIVQILAGMACHILIHFTLMSVECQLMRHIGVYM